MSGRAARRGCETTSLAEASALPGGSRRRQPEIASNKSASKFSLLRWLARAGHYHHRDRSDPNNNEGSKKSSRRRRGRRWRGSSSGSEVTSPASDSSASSTCSSATVRSFSFRSGAPDRSVRTQPGRHLVPESREVGPFASGAVRLHTGCTEHHGSEGAVLLHHHHHHHHPHYQNHLHHHHHEPNSTLPSALYTRGADLETRYAHLLQPVGPPFISYDSIPFPRYPTDESRGTTLVLGSETPSSSSACSSVARKAHVKGKRRAPDPPAQAKPAVNRDNHPRKRRPAPEPPQAQSPAAGQVLGGLLAKRESHASPVAMPRPWGPGSPESSRLSAFHRGVVERLEDSRRRDQEQLLLTTSSTGSSKQRSSVGLTLLSNISELDKEAAAIVQEEQARASRTASTALLLQQQIDRGLGRANCDLVEEIVNAAVAGPGCEYQSQRLSVQPSQHQGSLSPRRSARALISRFNALGSNLSSGLFSSKSSSSSPRSLSKRSGAEGCEFGSAGRWTQRIPADTDDDECCGPRDQSRGSRLWGGGGKTASPSRIRRAAERVVSSNNPPELVRLSSPRTTRTLAMDGVSGSNAVGDDNRPGINLSAGQIRPAVNSAGVSADATPPEPGTGRPRGDGDSCHRETAMGRQPEGFAGLDKEFGEILEEIDKRLKSPLGEPSPELDRDILNNVDRGPGAEHPSKNFESIRKVVVEPQDSSSSSENLEKPLAGPRIGAGTASSSSNSSASSFEDGKKSASDLKLMLREMKHSLSTRQPQNEAKVLNTTSQNVFRPVQGTKVSSAVQTNGQVCPRVLVASRIPKNAAATDVKIGIATGASDPDGDDGSIDPLYHTTNNLDVKSAKIPGETNTGPARVVGMGSPKIARANSPARSEPTSGCEAGARADGTADANWARSGTPPRHEPSAGRALNTLAVNRLLRKLETAIASGNHEQAARLARQLAQLKINCTVVRQKRAVAGSASAAFGVPRNDNDDDYQDGVGDEDDDNKVPDAELNLSLYVEDKKAHQGPIPLRVAGNMSIAQLKKKIHVELKIPEDTQRWIIGKNLADNDKSTPNELGATDGSSVFLYLIVPGAGVPQTRSNNEITPHRDEAVAPSATTCVSPSANGGVINNDNGSFAPGATGAVQPGPPRRENHRQQRQRQPPAPGLEISQAGARSLPEPTGKEKNNDGPRVGALGGPLGIGDLADNRERAEPSIDASPMEKLMRYNELVSLENYDVIPSAVSVECPICFAISAPHDAVILRDCLHAFCRSCMADTILYCEEAEVKCPYRDNDYACESTLQEREIKALVTPEVYQQHLDKSIIQAETSAGNNAFHCKTPDCPGWCIYDDNVNNFLCPVCKRNNCLTCQAIHMGQNCRQYQEQLKFPNDSEGDSKRTAAMLNDMVNAGEALPCPTCAVVLMKKWGCDWLRCSMCKTEICWVTKGPRWGPGGKGDTSGGCRCGENGVKCHPSCNYCH